MSSYHDLQTGATTSFDLNAPAILGTGVRNAIIDGVVSYDIARLLDDVDARHAQVYSTLNDPTILNDPKSYRYVVLTIESSTRKLVYGIPWIKEATIVTGHNNNLMVRILNVSAINQAKLRGLLSYNGYVVDSIAIDILNPPLPL